MASKLSFDSPPATPEQPTTGLGNNDEARAARATAWSRYWQSGVMQSCDTGQDRGDAGVIGTHWQRLFNGFANRSCILDIACGNGPLAAMSIAMAPSRSFDFHGVDMADVEPAWVKSVAPSLQKQVTFHARTRAEHLPMADQSVHVVVSQFGMEYTQPEASLPEAVTRSSPSWAVALGDASC